MGYTAARGQRADTLRPGREIKDKKQISFADKDARIMGKKGDVQLRLQRTDRDGRGRADHRQPGAERAPAGQDEPGQRLLHEGEPRGSVGPGGGVEAYNATDRGEKQAATGVDDGAGKWRLSVESDRPIMVMNLLSSPTGHLTNLSTAPAVAYPAPP